MIPEKLVPASLPLSSAGGGEGDTLAAHNFRDLTGQRFTRLFVEEQGPKNKHNRATWRCLCDCGNRIYPDTARLKQGVVRSCGCLQRELAAERRRTHGLTNHVLFRTWTDMRSRCSNPSHRQYPDYGGRGVRVCARWAADFTAFLADMGERPAGMTLDRIDVNGDYEPLNCRWADHKTQQNNRRPRLRHQDVVGHQSTGWAYLLGI